MAKNELVLMERRDNGVVYLTLNRPEKKNALSAELAHELLDDIREIDADAEIRCVILRGAGGSFSAGGDLGPFIAGEKQTMLQQRNGLILLGNIISSIVRCDKPFIAQVEGYALGAGLSLPMACDLIFASESAQMASMFTHVGISPEMGALLFLPQSIGMYKAKEMWYSGRRVGAKEAFDMGMISRVYPDDKIEEETLAMADHIATLPRITMTMMKRSLNSHTYTNLEAILSLDAANTPQCMGDEEAMQYLKDNFRKK
ncbi:MAG: enoyl-CoA hydratase/isomerase family protein [Coriobacteriales bacterium]|jgi:2-(1,2-epoxy-1,2-dihydrophenyl)acetyl-CoA isomerase|nr:enoyl-CoA hydratase/isomerase family protein [Coriobacteriales bacterium]